MRKMVVTGVGLCSSIGCDAASCWTHVAGSSRGGDPGQKLQPGDSSTLGRRRIGGGLLAARDMSELAASEALCEAGLLNKDAAVLAIDPSRVGCTFSASKPLSVDSSQAGGESWVPPDEINQFICQRFQAAGERRTIVAACATGSYSIALASMWIEEGICDVVLAGSVEPYPHPLFEAGFRRLGVISSSGITRPFDRRRNGFTFGEGAGAIVLESADHARRRGARPLASLSGWALGSDSSSPVAFNSNGRHVASVIGQSLRRAALTPGEVSHVHAHGTATRLNDRIETQALLQAFGKQADRLMVSATKGSTGHLLGASGSVEFILTVLALSHQFIPPTVTLEEPDPDCPLDYTPQKGHAATFDHAMTLSFGFGGSIAALIISR